jgi:hypothetical protein
MSDVQPTQDAPKQVRLVDVSIDSENTALNVMAGFLNLAQRRGAFSIDESAKIYECIRMFASKDASPAEASAEENTIVA